MRSLAYSGAVDADGHILEAPDLWEKYVPLAIHPTF